MCRKKKISYQGDEITGWTRYGSYHTPKLECKHTFLDKQNYESERKENYKHESKIEKKKKITIQHKILKDMTVSVHDVASLPLIEVDSLEPRLNFTRAQDVQLLTTMISVEPIGSI
jgi:hypothetical protein